MAVRIVAVSDEMQSRMTLSLNRTRYLFIFRRARKISVLRSMEY
jgi:hypothetical protein